MRKKVKYTNEPLGRFKVVPDFLPPPDQMDFSEDAEDLAATEARAHEPNLPFDDVAKELKRKRKK